MSTIEGLRKIYPEISKGYVDTNHNNKKDKGEEVAVKEKGKEVPAILEAVINRENSLPNIVQVMEIVRNSPEDIDDLHSYYKGLNEKQIHLRKLENGERTLKQDKNIDGHVFKAGTYFKQVSEEFQEENGDWVQELTITGTPVKDEVFDGVNFSGEMVIHRSYDGRWSIIKGTGMTKGKACVMGYEVPKGCVVTYAEGRECSLKYPNGVVFEQLNDGGDIKATINGDIHVDTLFPGLQGMLRAGSIIVRSGSVINIELKKDHEFYGIWFAPGVLTVEMDDKTGAYSIKGIAKAGQHVVIGNNTIPIKGGAVVLSGGKLCSFEIDGKVIIRDHRNQEILVEDVPVTYVSDRSKEYLRCFDSVIWIKNDLKFSDYNTGDFSIIEAISSSLNLWVFSDDEDLRDKGKKYNAELSMIKNHLWGSEELSEEKKQEYQKRLIEIWEEIRIIRNIREESGM